MEKLFHVDYEIKRFMKLPPLDCAVIDLAVSFGYTKEVWRKYAYNVVIYISYMNLVAIFVFKEAINIICLRSKADNIGEIQDSIVFSWKPSFRNFIKRW